jgi:hypothetical protein
MKKILFLIFLVSIPLYSQSTAGNKAIYESLYIVDFPTAGIQPNKHLTYDLEVFDDGGVLLTTNYTVWKRLTFGLSYGGTGIIGNSDINFQNIPGINLKVRAFNESIYTPAVALGFDSQGRGGFDISSNRFEYLPPHLFLSLSKNFIWKLGSLALHGGVNYNAELKEENRNINFFFGLEQSLGSNNAIVAEYIASNYNDILTENKGYLNIAYRYSLHKGVTLELKLRDILQNNKNANNYSRVLRIEIITNL